MQEWYQENQPNLKIQVKRFLKYPLWSIAAKLENIWTKIFLQEVDQESYGRRIFVKFWSSPYWLLTPPCFLVKISQILQKVIVFLPKRGEKIKTSFWHIWIAQWLKFFCATAYFFDFDHLQEEKRVESWTKSANFGSIHFS